MCVRVCARVCNREYMRVRGNSLISPHKLQWLQQQSGCDASWQPPLGEMPVRGKLVRHLQALTTYHAAVIACEQVPP